MQGAPRYVPTLRGQLLAEDSEASARVSKRFGLRDWSGDWDDKYDGQVFFAVVGEQRLVRWR